MLPVPLVSYLLLDLLVEFHCMRSLTLRVLTFGSVICCTIRVDVDWKSLAKAVELLWYVTILPAAVSSF